MTEQSNAGVFPELPPRPPFDPELVPVWEQLRTALPRFSTETLAVMRQMMSESFGHEPVDFTAGGYVA